LNSLPPLDNGTFTSLASSPSGSLVVGGTSNGAIYFWDAKKNVLLSERTISTLSGRVINLAVSHNGRILASVHPGKLMLWNLETGKQLGEITQNGLNVNTIAFSMDDTYLVGGGDDSSVRVWDVSDNTLPLVRWWEGTNGRIWAVCGSSNGSLLAVAAERRIILWDVATGSILNIDGSFSYHYKNNNVLVFSPDGEYLALGNDMGNSIRVWHWLSGEWVFEEGLNGDIALMTFSPDGVYLVAGATGSKGQLVMWKVARGEQAEWEKVWETRLPYMTSAAFTPDGRLLIVGTKEGVSFLDSTTGNVLRAIDVGAAVDSVLIRNAGLQVVAGGEDGVLYVLGVPHWKLIPTDTPTPTSTPTPTASLTPLPIAPPNVTVTPYP
ncbi:hypothetical protein D6779_00415, partial [Candidatus Parcubacteria bacterium]